MRRKLLTLSALALFIPLAAFARKEDTSDPVGTISYCLPNTSLTFEVEAVEEVFHAGPYAKYAQKYIGVEARQQDETTYSLVSVTMTPYIEADQSSRYLLNVGSASIDASSFMSLTSCGLVAGSDANFGVASVWRFPVENREGNLENGLISNVSSESTTLYRNVKEEDAYTRVAVQQEVMVAKTVEQKASETAQLIFNLRRKRIQILTGDTDATYSGEAMGAAVAEIARLEKEYMSMFIGYTTTSVQTKKYDVVPEKDRTIYVAFRFSESSGLLNSDDLSGKSMLLEITPTEIPNPDSKTKKSSNTDNYVRYRVPSVCTIKLLNGSEALMSTRLPIYQYGFVSTFPLTTKVK